MNLYLHDHSELFTEYGKRKELECYELEARDRKSDTMNVAADIFEQQVNNLKCCGNCKNNHVTSIDTYCEISGDEINGHKICSNWTPDGLTRKNRE